jgi:hypothetical protein
MGQVAVNQEVAEHLRMSPMKLYEFVYKANIPLVGILPRPDSKSTRRIEQAAIDEFIETSRITYPTPGLASAGQAAPVKRAAAWAVTQTRRKRPPRPTSAANSSVRRARAAGAIERRGPAARLRLQSVAMIDTGRPRIVILVRTHCGT